jgi:hypothetical protein
VVAFDHDRSPISTKGTIPRIGTLVPISVLLTRFADATLLPSFWHFALPLRHGRA